MTTTIMMTREGYEKLKRELENLKTVKRREITEKIRVARGFGDLSENSEYDEAKNEQAIVEARIVTLEEQLKACRIIEKKDIMADAVSIGSQVKIFDFEYNEECDYLITSSVEPSGSMNTITDTSPAGKALLGHKVGETVDVLVPSGKIIKYKILEIS